MKAFIAVVSALILFSIGHVAGMARTAELTQHYCDNFGYFYITEEKYECSKIKH